MKNEYLQNLEYNTWIYEFLFLTANLPGYFLFLFNEYLLNDCADLNALNRRQSDCFSTTRLQIN